MSPWLTLAEATDDELRATLEAAARLMRGRLDGAPRAAPRLPAQAAGVPALRRRRSARGRSATRRAWRTGAPAAKEERARPRSNEPRGRARAAPLSLPARVRARRVPPVRRRGPAVRVRGARVARRPALYEYRPLVRTFLEARASALAQREDARLALEDLRREPAARIFARAHAGRRASEDEALFRTVVAAAADRDRRRLRRLRLGRRARSTAPTPSSSSRSSARDMPTRAVAPLVGISRRHADRARRRRARAQRRDGRARRALAGGAGPAAARTSAARPTGSACSSSSAASRRASRRRRTRRASSPTPSPRSASRRRAPIAAGPVLFERLDWRPYGIRPVLPIAATQPHGEPTRLDEFRGRLAAELRARLLAADEDHELGDALDRWELSLFQADPFRARAAARVARRAARRRRRAVGRLRARRGRCSARRPAERGRAPRAAGSDAPSPDLVRRALVEVVMHGDRRELIASLDDVAARAAPRPAGYFTLRAAS